MKFHHIGPHHRRHFVFRCDCGNTKILQAANVSSGNTKSCGCMYADSYASRRLPGNLGVIRHLILQYKRHARDRGIDFELSENQFTSLLSKPCFYCGLPPSNNKITKNCTGFLYSGIDRKNPSRGYTIKNVVSCCSHCNRAKREMSVKDFVRWVLKVASMAEQWGRL